MKRIFRKNWKYHTLLRSVDSFCTVQFQYVQDKETYGDRRRIKQKPSRTHLKGLRRRDYGRFDQE
ncbi:MAG TPA: hypothetical protein V6D11_27665 [Waterburya sp.]